ncbi:DUF488 domain-containing protein [Streptomyces mirabilis]|uniref:DUF488 domain-containing protein n=1 Tax=Streptomyces mirabilis TaxID=68239 RepID=UPI002258F7F4|nr:DUF488 family protein [Streptomyces mirabilis]MCX4430185.1 DUF488 family protein [Streptomyces mirabilis]
MAKQITYHGVYEETSPKGGKRILVDHVWPRGMRKEDALLDEWLRHVAPSSDLRRMSGHEARLFAEFHRRYLSAAPAMVRSARSRRGCRGRRRRAGARRGRARSGSRRTGDPTGGRGWRRAGGRTR